jgi:hypothetical protein
MRCHSDVLSWVNVPYGLMYRWVHVKVDDCYLIMVDRKYQMDELQSGPLMVKSLTGRCFVKSKWLSG